MLYKYTPHDFHYKFYVDLENPNNMEIIYDKKNHTLVNMESYRDDREIKNDTIVVEPQNINMEEFSFIKYPKFFDDKKKFYKIYEIKQ